MFTFKGKQLVQALAVLDLSLLFAIIDGTSYAASEAIAFMLFCILLTYIAVHLNYFYGIVAQIIYLLVSLIIGNHLPIDLFKEALILVFVSGILLVFEERHKHTMELASKDHLTGVYNRRTADKRLKDVYLSYAKSGFGVIFVDLDKFKDINDTYGHSVGDKILSEIGKRLRESVRNVDICARYGGDEFLIILPSIKNSMEVNEIAQRILSNVKSIEIKHENKIIRQGVSLGIATCPQDNTDMQELIQIADQRVYDAKTAGGSRAFDGKEYYIVNN